MIQLGLHLTLILLVILPFQLFAVCKPDKKFRKFIVKEKLLTQPQINSLLIKYSKKKKISITCAQEMSKAILLEEALKWKQIASSKRCFDNPPGKYCPKNTRSEIFGHFTFLETLLQTIDKNSIDCKHTESSFSTSIKLTKGSVDILRVLNKLQRLEDKLQLNQKECEEDSKISSLDSPNSQYFKELLKKGVEAPLDDFLKFWYPNEEVLKEDPQSVKCRRLESDYVYGNLDYLTEECKPEALYSWGPSIKLENMKKVLSDNKLWKGSPNPIKGKPTTLFMARTPVSSFGYGDIAVRIKLKKGTPFPFEHHTFYNSGTSDYSNVDGVMMNRAWYKDYMLKNSTFIESWSFGTPQLYDEMVRDILRLKTKKSAEVYASNGKNDPKQGLKNLFDQKVDRKDFSEKELKRKLLKHISMVLSGEGRVHFQKGSCRNIQRHYKTDKPTYFNPN
jgi:hypothetical protein